MVALAFSFTPLAAVIRYFLIVVLFTLESEKTLPLARIEWPPTPVQYIWGIGLPLAWHRKVILPFSIPTTLVDGHSKEEGTVKQHITFLVRSYTSNVDQYLYFKGTSNT